MSFWSQAITAVDSISMICLVGVHDIIDGTHLVGYLYTYIRAPKKTITTSSSWCFPRHKRRCMCGAHPCKSGNWMHCCMCIICLDVPCKSGSRFNSGLDTRHTYNHGEMQSIHNLCHSNSHHGTHFREETINLTEKKSFDFCYRAPKPAVMGLPRDHS